MEEREVLEEFVVKVEVTHEVGDGLSVSLVCKTHTEVSVDTTQCTAHSSSLSVIYVNIYITSKHKPLHFNIICK